VQGVYSPAVIRELTRPLTELSLDRVPRLWATRQLADDNCRGLARAAAGGACRGLVLQHRGADPPPMAEPGCRLRAECPQPVWSCLRSLLLVPGWVIRAGWTSRD